MIAKQYKKYLAEYIEFAKKCGYQETFAVARLEAQFESLKDWSLVGDLNQKKEWYLSQVKNCQMRVEEISLDDCKGWKKDENGNIVHESGDFFKIQGLRVSLSQSREVTQGWDQPILTQIGFDGGLLGILRKRINGIPHYLLEAKAEPGNYGVVLLSPTLQATFSNLRRSHGGKKPHFADIFESPEKESTVVFSGWLSEDGGRLNKKRNFGMLVEMDEAIEINAGDTFEWFSLWQIKELINENAWVNPHIRSIISHL